MYSASPEETNCSWNATRQWTIQPAGLSSEQPSAFNLPALRAAARNPELVEAEPPPLRGSPPTPSCKEA